MGLSVPHLRRAIVRAATRPSSSPGTGLTPTTGVDAVEFYPEWLYMPKDSPLHFLHTIREHYIAEYNDPIFNWKPERGPSFAPLFLYYEMIYMLPVVLFTVYRLARGRGITGPHELLLVIYGFATAGTCGICLNDITYWDPNVYSAEQKDVFRYQLYGPWFVIRESTPLFHLMPSSVLTPSFQRCWFSSTCFGA